MTSPVAEVRVEEPPAPEREAMELWMKENNARRFLRRRVPEEALEPLRHLIEDYPHSRYALYAAYALAGKWEIQSDAVVPLYERWAQSKEPFPFWDVVLFHLAQYYYQQRRYPECRACLERLERLAYVNPDYRANLWSLRWDAVWEDDPRLDQVVTTEYRTPTPLEEILQDWTRQTNISFSVAEELKERKSSKIRSTEPLRDLMRRHASPPMNWVRPADGGYQLIVVPDATAGARGQEVTP